MERWQIQPFISAPRGLVRCESEQFTLQLKSTYPQPSGFFCHWNTIQSSYWAHNAFACAVPTPWMVPPEMPMPLACFRCSSSPSPFPFSTSPLFSGPHDPKEMRTGQHIVVICDPCSPGASYFILSFCGGFLHVIYFRFVGEKRAPQKKVLSWRKQRMQESRCRSRSTNSLNPEISTTTCAGPPLPGSGILRSRCASFYSITHPHSLQNTYIGRTRLS